MPALPAPAAPAGANDAQTALYYSTAAELAHAYEHTLASDQEALSNDQAAFRAGQAKLNAAEPTAMTNIRNRANAEGLATSGIEGQRADTQQAAFTRSLAALDLNREQNTTKINRNMTEAAESYADRMKANLAARESEAQKEAQANATNNPELGATAPAPAATVPPVAATGPGGNRRIVGLPSIPEGKVRPQAIRRAAAKRVAVG